MLAPISSAPVATVLFLFWQCFHIFDVSKTNVRQGKSLGWTLPFDLALLAIGAYGIYVSTDWLVNWISHIHTGFISVKYLGWLSGWLMVLPNAMLAVYYSWRGQPETVYASQVGDSHVSIPCASASTRCITRWRCRRFSTSAMFILLGATMVHFFFVAVLGQLPRAVGLGAGRGLRMFPVEGIARLNGIRWIVSRSSIPIQRSTLKFS